MTRTAAGAAGILAAFLLLLAPLGAQHGPALAASAAALALLTAAVHCVGVLPLLGPAEAARTTVAARSGLAADVPPQRDPDAAGKPRPRAPGVNPRTV
jgi:Family of unknown function (DUF6412)